MPLCAAGCSCMFCGVNKMVEHPAYKARLQLLVGEFQHEVADSQEWKSWKKKYRSWNAENLDSCGVRTGNQFVWILKDHPVMDMVRCNVDIQTPNVTDGVWHELDRVLFDSCCQTLRARFDFLKKGPSVEPHGLC
jgi:hypothetical protein